MATLGALSGHEIEVRAGGRQAREALDALLGLAARDFDEPADAAAPRRRPRPSPPPPGGPDPDRPGRGVGPVCPGAPAGRRERHERRRPGRRVAAAHGGGRGRARHRRGSGPAPRGSSARDEAGIFDAHLLLDDADLLAGVKRRVDAGRARPRPGPDRWATSSGRAGPTCPTPTCGGARRTSPRCATRCVRVADRRRRPPQTGPSGVVVASDLTPAETAGLDTVAREGVCWPHGSPTSHAAILARARAASRTSSRPGRTCSKVARGHAARRGRRRRRDPRRSLACVVGRAAPRAADWRATGARPGAGRAGAACLPGRRRRRRRPPTSGRSPTRVPPSRAGADAAGLVRSEFLFLGRDAAPDVDEQEQEYAAIAEALGGRRVDGARRSTSAVTSRCPI